MATFTGFPWGAVIVYTFMVIGVIATGVVIGEVWFRWRSHRIDHDQNRPDGWRD